MEKTYQAVLAATGSFFAITVIFALIYLLLKASKSKSTSSSRHRRRAAAVRHNYAAADESASFDPSLEVSMDQVVKATRNFSSDLVVGDGGFGLVYKARLPADGLIVAVKKLDPDAFQGFREFRAEMETLGKLRHPNIVKILGYCISGVDRILIYEFIERGNLDRWLHDSSSTDHDDDTSSAVKLPLSWKTRNKIVRGVANGLAYLHGLDKAIIHRDIKASNVLLDKEFEAHIADFGLARCIDTSRSHVSTQFAGTMGYMPPEYIDGFTGASVKADVFSFGILMLEVATGRRPHLKSVLDGKEMKLVEWSRKMAADNRHMELVDTSVSREDLDQGSVKKYFEIACQCAHEFSRQRPQMKDVIEMLNDIHRESARMCE